MPIAQYGPTWKVFFFHSRAGAWKVTNRLRKLGEVCPFTARLVSNQNVSFMLDIGYSIGKVKAVLAQIRQAVNDLGS